MFGIPGAGEAPSVIVAKAFQRGWLDVAAADDRDVESGVGELVAAKEKSRGGDGAAGFSHCRGIGGQELCGLANLVFAHGNDAVDEAPYVLEVDRADALGSQAVGDRV